ncbi:MAG: diaminopimelate epimerase [Ruminococcaceae bacterium]|nr:diaminopimelate epimerase [Oscillospiraceae bacterium]
MEHWHMSGAGNDFAVVDVRGENYDLQNLAIRLCKETGADGFLALDHSEIADFRLHFYNSDGLRGEMCGNGARCICRFAYDKGICGENMVMETDAGPVPGWYLGGDQYRVQLNLPSVLDFLRAKPAIYVELGDPGIPHALLEIADTPCRERLLPQALALRHHSAFPKGANVSFFQILGENTLNVLTYERGVEDYTLACGTGCGSIAAALWAAGRLPEKELLCHNPGGDLRIRLEAEGNALSAIFLTGPATILSKGSI